MSVTDLNAIKLNEWAEEKMDNFLSSTNNGDSNLTVAWEEESSFSSIYYRNSETPIFWAVVTMF